MTPAEDRDLTGLWTSEFSWLMGGANRNTVEADNDDHIKVPDEPEPDAESSLAAIRHEASLLSIEVDQLRSEIDIKLGDYAERCNTLVTLADEVVADMDSWPEAEDPEPSLSWQPWVYRWSMPMVFGVIAMMLIAAMIANG